MTDPSPHTTECTRCHLYYNQQVCAFIERYAPRSYEGRDFEHELRSLITLAAELAQEPFAYELHTYREAIATDTLLRPLNVRT